MCVHVIVCVCVCVCKVCVCVCVQLECVCVCVCVDASAKISMCAIVNAKLSVQLMQLCKRNQIKPKIEPIYNAIRDSMTQFSKSPFLIKPKSI